MQKEVGVSEFPKLICVKRDIDNLSDLIHILILLRYIYDTTAGICHLMQEYDV